jgi:DNA-binding CsgD family transcriptional regulator
MTGSQKLSALLEENNQLRKRVHFLEEILNKSPGWVQINQVEKNGDQVSVVNVFTNQNSLETSGNVGDEIAEFEAAYLNEAMHLEDTKSAGEVIRRFINLADNEVIGGFFRSRLPGRDYIWTLVRSRVFRRNPDGTPSHFLNWIVELNRDIQSKQQMGEFVKEIYQFNNDISLPKISKREKEVLALISVGLSARLISEKLNISILTVDTHRKNLLKKLNLHNIAALASFAAGIGI